MAENYKFQKVGDHVTLRARATVKGWSLYLDIYDGGDRSREFLKKHLKKGDKVANSKLWLEAIATAKARDEEIEAQRTGIPLDRGKKVRLLDWMAEREKRMRQRQEDQHKKRLTSATLVRMATRRLKDYLKQRHLTDIMLADIDDTFVRGWGAHVSKMRKEDGSGPLSPNTKHSIYRLVLTAINEAAGEGLMRRPSVTSDTALPVKRTTMHERAFLTETEIKALAATPCKRPEVKAAFMFSVFTGLRWSDLMTLTWGDIIPGEEGQQPTVEKTMVKTGKPVKVVINTTAEKFLPERRADSERVFPLPLGHAHGLRVLKDWTEAAGIKKLVGFHTARHTFATLAITKGVDIFTVSKALGHANVTTTQIYAKLVDEKKRELADKIDIKL